MANMALLNNVDHADLKVIADHGAAFGDALNMAAVYPTEFVEVQREYPILFQKDESAGFRAVALLGFDAGENLFLDTTGWRARHIPMIHQRGPFKIGFQDQEVGGQTRREPIIYIDLDHPRVSKTEGRPLFLPNGGHSPYLQHVSHVLRVLHIGAEVTAPMFTAFEEAGLIEPAALDVNLDDHTRYKVPDIYTISGEKLAALGGSELENLHKAGYLRAAYMVLASMPNVNRLIAMKNARRAGEVS